MATPERSNAILEPEARQFYSHALDVLEAHNARFLVGGAYALAHYTGIHRHTKDLDVFVHPGDVPRLLELLAGSGCETDVTFPHWLAKARCGEHYVDLIFGSGNGVATVADEWFEQAVGGMALDRPVKLVPAEEMIWSKAFIQERERFDGADVMHLIRALGPQLSWQRLLQRFGDRHWRVLFTHLVMFGFVYPSERDKIPDWVIRELMDHLADEMLAQPGADPLCRGPLLSRQQYLVDLQQWGYADARVRGESSMTPGDVSIWTAGIAVDGADA